MGENAAPGDSLGYHNDSSSRSEEDDLIDQLLPPLLTLKRQQPEVAPEQARPRRPFADITHKEQARDNEPDTPTRCKKPKYESPQLYAEARAGRRQQQQQVGDYPKPPYSYSCLVVLALKNSQHGFLPVLDIYSFIRNHFPFFELASDVWKNSVRHNLSLSKGFDKVGRYSADAPASKKGCLWALNPDRLPKMDEEISRAKAKELNNVLASMRFPERFAIVESGCHGFGGLASAMKDKFGSANFGSVLRARMKLVLQSEPFVELNREFWDNVPDSGNMLSVNSLSGGSANLNYSSIPQSSQLQPAPTYQCLTPPRPPGQRPVYHNTPPPSYAQSVASYPANDIRSSPAYHNLSNQDHCPVFPQEYPSTPNRDPVMPQNMITPENQRRILCNQKLSPQFNTSPGMHNRSVFHVSPSFQDLTSPLVLASSLPSLNNSPYGNTANELEGILLGDAHFGNVTPPFFTQI